MYIMSGEKRGVEKLCDMSNGKRLMCPLETENKMRVVLLVWS